MFNSSWILHGMIVLCRVNLQLQKEYLKINAKKEKKLAAAWISFNWIGRICWKRLLQAIFVNQMLKITFMYKKLRDLIHVWSLFRPWGDMIRQAPNEKKKTEDWLFDTTDLWSYSTAAIPQRMLKFGQD